MSAERKIKCLVWDLDNTIWHGTVLEDDRVTLKHGIAEIIKQLDARGILQSVASRNDYDTAMSQLKDFGLDEYFLYPQIGWGEKSKAVENIRALLNIAMDSMAFIDDQPMERFEVAHACPQVLTLDAEQYEDILSMPEFSPRFITEDSKYRRQMYKSDQQRKKEESEYTGSNDSFLKTLGMRLSISRVRFGDLERVEELTLRTNQLNSTGVTYDYEELLSYIDSPEHIFLIAGLEDRFGTYGKIGLVLAHETDEALHIKLLLMSCRVMTRGIGSAMLIQMIKMAEERGKKLKADFIDTGRNRVMYITYKLMGFYEEAELPDKSQRLQYTGDLREYPDYLQIELEQGI